MINSSSQQILPLLLKVAEAGVAKKSDPGKWEAAKREAKSKMGGRHSARAMQLATQIYKKNGGGYKGKEPSASNNKLKKWTKQDWQWSGERDKESSALGILVEKLAGKGVYLPAKSIDALKSTAEGRNKLRAAGRKKTEATNNGQQFSRHGLHEGKDRGKLGYYYIDTSHTDNTYGNCSPEEIGKDMFIAKTASYQDSIVSAYRTGQKLAYAAFGRRHRTKLGEELPMGVPDELPGDMAPPPANRAPPTADMAPPPADLAPRPARKAPPPAHVSTKYPPRPPKPARAWTDSMAQGIDNYMSSHGAIRPELYTGDNLGQRALHLATARRQAIHGDDPMLGFSTPEEMDSWYTDQARAAASGYNRAMREKDLGELETGLDIAASPTPLGRLADLAYAGYRSVSRGREMGRQMDEVLSRLPPGLRERIQTPPALQTTLGMYSDSPSAAQHDALNTGGLGTGLYGFATGSNPIGIAGKGISHLAHKINTTAEYDGIPGEDEQAYYDYFGGRSRGTQALDSTLASTLEHNREYLKQHPEDVGAILGLLYQQQGGVNSSELHTPSNWQEAMAMARSAKARSNKIDYDAKLQYPNTYKTLYPNKPVPTRTSAPNPSADSKAPLN